MAIKDFKELARIAMRRDRELDEPASSKAADPLRPRGRPLPPVRGRVTISDEDIDAAIAEWDEDVPDAAGLLRATSA